MKKYKHKPFFLFIILFCVFSQNILGNTFVFRSSDHPLAIGKNITYFEDKLGRETIASIQHKPFVSPTESNKNLNFGVTSSVYWFKITIQNQSLQPLFLEIGEPVLDSITIFILRNKQLVKTKYAGIYVPWEKRDVQTNCHLIDLALPTHQTQTYYIRVRNTLPLLLPASVGSAQAFLEDSHSKDLLQGMYLGVMLIMAFYNLIIWFSTQEKPYIYYVLYTLSLGLFFAFNKGFAQEYLWPGNLDFNRYTSVFITAVIGGGLLFTDSFLEARKYLPQYSKVILYCFLLIIVASLGVNWAQIGAWTTNLIHLEAIIAVIYIVFLAIYISWKGSKPARFFLIAWGFLLVGAIIFTMQLSGLVASNSFTKNCFQIGSILEVTLLSFALAYRINLYRQENEHYQEEVIKQLKDKEQIRKRIARDLHDDLGSTLSSISMLSQLADRFFEKDPERVYGIIKRIKDSSLRVQDHLSDIVWAARHIDEEFSKTVVKMREFAIEMLEPKNINCHFYTEDQPLPPDFLTNNRYDFYAIFKEAINNIAKYAQATEVEVVILVQKQVLILEIKDNGVGFDEKNIKKGNGLNNMQERAKKMNAILEIKPVLEQGTCVRLEIPLSS